MIWQLFRRDPMWKPLVGSTGALFALLAAAVPRHVIQHSGLDAFEVVPAALIMAMMIALHLNTVSQRATLEAALPIDPRDLWCSRALTMLAAVWVPFLCATAAGLPLMKNLEAAAIFSVAAVLASFWIGGSPQLRRTVTLLAFIAGGALPAIIIGSRGSLDLSWLPASVVLPVCAVATIALFIRGWMNPPNAVQPAKPAAATSIETGTAISTATSASLRAKERKVSRFVLSPVLRSIYSSGMILQLFLLFTFMTLGVFTPLTWLIVFSPLQIHAKYRWLHSLPFSARKLFAWIALPPALIILLGCMANILIDTDHPLSATERSIEIALLLTFFYAMLFLCELPAWRRLSRLVTIRWGAAILWAPFALTILAWFVVPLRNRDIQHLAGLLPAQPWQLAALSLPAVIATYWLAEKAFAERENRPTMADRTAQQPL